MQNVKKSNFPNELEKEKRMLSDYARYSNLAFKMIAVVLTAFFIGWQVDKWIHVGFPLFTLLFSVGALIMIIFLLIKDLSK